MDKPYKIIKTKDNRLALKILREEEQKELLKDEESSPQVEGDLNGDGVFDKTDKTIAARTLRKRVTRKTSKK